MNSAEAPQWSIVIPAYNEAAVIAQTLQDIAIFLQARAWSAELLVVDDGSSDQTLERVREAMRAIPALRLLRTPHQGKGAAVRTGMLAATGHWRVFLDADHSTRIDELPSCAEWLRRGEAVVIGSRKIAGARIHIRQPLLRELMGKTFTRFTNLLLTVRVSDITCGFKCFTREAAGDIFRRQRIDGWGFDAEILFLARRLGYSIKEVPVAWTNDPTTNVRLAGDALRSFKELLAIRLGSWRGWYRPGSVTGDPAPVTQGVASPAIHPIASTPLQPRHCATASGRGRHGGATADGGAGCRPHRGRSAGATDSARGAPQ